MCYALLWSRSYRIVSKGAPGLRCLGQRKLSTFPDLPIFRALVSHPQGSIAIVDPRAGLRCTFAALLKDVELARIKLHERLRSCTPQDQEIDGQRVAYLVENGYDHVVTLLSIFACNAIAVPLAPSFPVAEHNYILENTQAALILTSPDLEANAEPIRTTTSRPTVRIASKITGDDVLAPEDIRLTKVPMNKGGLMLYTSGTTSQPKGIVLHHEMLESQIQSLINAWRCTPSDRLLHILPLHHIHGAVNALLTPMTAGASVEFLHPFNPETVWNRLASGICHDDTKGNLDKVTFLTAVPTIYNRLLSSYKHMDPETQNGARQAINRENLRLNISGSAALPAPTRQSWLELSEGNALLERYGMTEVGMALSCGMAMADRVEGSVGWPLPGVEVRLVDISTGEIVEDAADGRATAEGEIQLRGPSIFKEYWRNETATAKEFIASADGAYSWFRTGDIAYRKTVEGAGLSEDQPWARGPCYFIQGRQSTDILKTGGEKVSALEVEREILALPEVEDVAVVGVPSERWGQKICAAVVLRDTALTEDVGAKQWSALDMRRALRSRLATHKMPQEMKVLAELPKNAMGKVNKKTLARDIFPQ